MHSYFSADISIKVVFLTTFWQTLKGDQRPPPDSPNPRSCRLLSSHPTANPFLIYKTRNDTSSLLLQNENKHANYNPFSWSYFRKSSVKMADEASCQLWYTPTRLSLRSYKRSLCEMIIHCVDLDASSIYFATLSTFALSSASSTSSRMKKGACLYEWRENSRARVAMVFSPPESWLISRYCFPTGLTVYLTPPK